MRFLEYLGERRIGKTDINYHVTKLPIGHPGRGREEKFIVFQSITSKEEKKGSGTKAFMDVINKYEPNVNFAIFSTTSKAGKAFNASLVKKGILKPIDVSPTGWTNKYKIIRKP
jgi:hypothetical protein